MVPSTTDAEKERLRRQLSDLMANVCRCIQIIEGECGICLSPGSLPASFSSHPTPPPGRVVEALSERLYGCVRYLLSDRRELRKRINQDVAEYLWDLPDD